MKVLLQLLLVLLSTSVFSQFQKSYITQGGSGVGKKSIELSDGVLTVAEYSFIPGSRTITLIKTDVNGKVIWSKKLTPPDTSPNVMIYEVRVFEQLSDKNMVIGGSVWCNNERVAFVYKIDSGGNILWSNRYFIVGEDQLTSIHETKETKDLVLCGTADRTEASGDPSDLFVTKINASGNLLWSKTLNNYYSGGQMDVALKALDCDDKGIILTGFTNGTAYSPSPNGGSQTLIIKMDKQGAVQWSSYLDMKVTPGLDYYDPTSMQAPISVDNIPTGFSKCGNQEYLLCGIGDFLFAGGTPLNYVMKFKENGTMLWCKTYKGGGVLWNNYLMPSNFLSAYTSEIIEQQNAIFITGVVSNPQTREVTLTKIDKSTLLPLWTKKYDTGGLLGSFCSDFDILTSGDLLLTGLTQSASDLNLITANPQGYSTICDRNVTLKRRDLFVQFNVLKTDELFVGKQNLVRKSFVEIVYDQLDVCSNEIPSPSSKIKPQELEKEEVVVAVYPNPSSGEVFLKMLDNTKQEEKTIRVELYNYLGHLVHEKTLLEFSQKIQKIDFPEDLITGVYFLKIYQQDKNLYQSKIQIIKD